MSFPLRLPDDVKAWLATSAAKDGRSQNSFVVQIFRQAMAAQAVDQQREETGASVSQTSAPAPRIIPEEPK